MSEFQKPWVREIRDEEWSRIFGGPNRVRDRVHGPESEGGKNRVSPCPQPSAPPGNRTPNLLIKSPF